MLLRRSLFAALFLVSAAQAAPLDAASRQTLVDGVIRELHKAYINPALAKQVEPALRRADYSRISDPEAFATAVTETMQQVTKDLHLRLEYEENGIPPAAKEKPSPEALARRAAFLRSNNYGIDRVERLPHNIGYLKTRFFPPAEHLGPALAAAMTLVANTDALIIDLRENRGGSAESVALMASYLFDKRTRLNDIYQREGDVTEQTWTSMGVGGQRFGGAKPVYILTSKNTFSAAEDITFALKNRKRAVIVGENTKGGAHPFDMKPLATHFALLVPAYSTVDPDTKKDWEGVGVAPDVAVPAAAALTRAQQLILETMKANAEEPEARKEIEARLKELAGA